MPTAKNKLWILNLHPKIHKKKHFFFNVASSAEVLATNKWDWIVASEHSALSVIETTMLFNP